MESAGAACDRADFSIEPLGPSVGKPGGDVREDSLEVSTHGPGQLLEWLQQLQPRACRLLDAVLLTVHARHVSDEDRLELARIEVAPASRPRVVAGARLVALRAGERRMQLRRDGHAHLLTLDVELHVADLPGFHQAEDAGVEVAVLQSSPRNQAGSCRMRTSGARGA